MSKTNTNTAIQDTAKPLATKMESTISLPRREKEYYSSTVGMWYCVWWDSEAMDANAAKWHWGKETRVKPIKHGYYASDDSVKLKDDFTYFHTIGIDYLILDDTNDHNADNGNIASHINACFKMVHDLGTDNAPKLCFAGGSPLLNGDEIGMIAEMDIFYNYATEYKANTFFWKGKPLIVNFNLQKNYGWQDPKNRFTMRPAAGHTTEGTTFADEYDLNTIGMYGWVFDRQYYGSEVFGLNAGWSRSHNGQEIGVAALSRENGEYYQRNWLQAIKAKPEMIVIASWNDHSEETGIEAVELLESIPGRGAEDPFFYQKITEGYLALKTGYLDGWYYRAESQSQTYQYINGKLQAVDTVPNKTAVIVVPDDYYAWAGVACIG